MQAHILSLHARLASGVWSKGQNIFFLEVVMLYIKLKGKEHRAPHKHIFCPYTHPLSLGWGQKVKSFFSESSPVPFKIKGNGA